jgi:hypothetical protein
MWLLLTAVILSNTAFSQPTSDTDKNLPVAKTPALQVGNTIISVRHPILQTGIAADVDGTVYLLTALANGDKKLMRLSRKYAAKKLILYQGWPYILTRRGKLYALNISWWPSLKNKLPAATGRFIRKLPKAGATGAGLFTLSALNLWLHGGAPSDSITLQPEMMGFSGVALYYLLDGTATLFFRRSRITTRGGNYFTTKVASRVKDVVEDKEKNDYRIVEFKAAAPQAQLFLSDVAPHYTRDSSCIYALTKFILR